ncbi:flagellar basal-body MS-ring/collar protein FliF [Plasticicumulans acidivorans]|uniref:Flagellar M-ring protein n=1 Tax=Plasticicumulans acidivorans TaxID=886464 RepID=A0A317MY63_9GAMM|nr:flagellar basal-body MS-ring/collar protein FliF [Plasticicumulans acidivorans]PWV63282.1 flagellar M-ring protein FliF [Plasticicumulans acidivorans]
MNEPTLPGPAEATSEVPARGFDARALLQRVRTPGPLMYGAIAAAIALFALVVALALWANRTEYQTLYAGLAEADAGQVMEALAKAQVPYRVDRDSGALMVPAERVHELRLKLAAQGLPRGATAGFEAMEQHNGFGTSQFMENARYQHALEGELARSIMSIGAVANARVHLAIPKDTVFVRNQQAPSASVMVQLQPGRVLDAGQVAAIVHLVSSSVPRLAAEQVSVVDQAGNLLTRPAGSQLGLNMDQMEYQNRLEGNYVRRIEDLLMPILGAGKVRAQVALDMDFSSREETTEAYDPRNPDRMVRSEQTLDENNARPNPAGIPGALSNQPPGVASAPQQAPGAPAAQPQGNAPNAPAQPGGGQSANGQLPAQAAAAAAAGANQTDAQAAADGSRPQRSRREVTRNYELDKTISHVRAAPGRVRRVSVAVVLDDRIGINESGTVARMPISQEELDRLTALVKEAVGFDAQRGDTVNVMNATFATTPFDPNLLPFWRQDWFIELVKWGLAALVAIVFMLLVLRPLMKRLLPPPPAPAALPTPAEAAPGTALAAPAEAAGGGEAAAENAVAVRDGDEDEAAVQLSAAGQALAAAAPAGPAPVTIPRPVNAEAIEKLEENLRIARALVSEDPKRAVYLLRGWMNRGALPVTPAAASEEEEAAEA